MQGYIIHTARARDEDMVVTLLGPHRLHTLYRFYGARHSVIRLGHKIDFEEEHTPGVVIGRLRNALHLGFPWLGEHAKLLAWQQWIKLLYAHLKGVETLEGFYLELLDRACTKLSRQHPKRVLVESYLALLHFEGRLQAVERCFLCEQPITQPQVALARAYLLAHPSCILGAPFEKGQIERAFAEACTMHLEDDEVERLYALMLEGL